MNKNMCSKTRSSESQPLLTGRFWGAHSQGLASTSAICQIKSERRIVHQNYGHFQK